MKPISKEQSMMVYSFGNYSAPGFIVHLTRNRASFILQIYMPSILFVVISWISFVIPHDSGERGALVITLLLVVVSMFLAVVAGSPRGKDKKLSNQKNTNKINCFKFSKVSYCN